MLKESMVLLLNETWKNKVPRSKTSTIPGPVTLVLKDAITPADALTVKIMSLAGVLHPDAANVLPSIVSVLPVV